MKTGVVITDTQGRYSLPFNDFTFNIIKSIIDSKPNAKVIAPDYVLKRLKPSNLHDDNELITLSPDEDCDKFIEINLANNQFTAGQPFHINPSNYNMFIDHYFIDDQGTTHELKLIIWDKLDQIDEEIIFDLEAVYVS
jgi:hypothetical protein